MLMLRNFIIIRLTFITVIYIYIIATYTYFEIKDREEIIGGTSSQC